MVWIKFLFRFSIKMMMEIGCFVVAVGLVQLISDINITSPIVGFFGGAVVAVMHGVAYVIGGGALGIAVYMFHRSLSNTMTEAENQLRRERDDGRV